MAFSYGVQGYGVPQQDEAPPNPFLGGGWDESQEPPPMLPQGEPFRSSGVSPDAADPFASTASAGSYEPGPQYWSPTGPINYAPDSPGMAPPAAAPDPMAQAQQSAFDRVFGGGTVGGDPFTSPASRPNPDGSALSTPVALSEALRLNREQGQNDITRAQVGAVMAKGKSDFDTNTLIQQDQERAKYQAAIDQAKQVSAQKIAQYQNMKPDSLFGSGSRGGNRETTIALMVLGGINDIMGNRQGQASSAMQALQIGMKQLETDDSIRFGKALTDAKSAQSDVKTLEAQREVGLAEIAHRNAARWKTVEDSVKAELAQMAPGEARVKAEQNALVIQQKSAQETQRAEVTAVDLAEKLLKLHAAQRKARAGATGTGDGSDGPIDIRTVLNSKGQPIGMAPGSAKVSTEGVKARAMYAQLDPIRDGLNLMREKIAATGTLDRFSGGLTDDMQKIKNLSESLVQPITTATGGGAAQREEAERQLGQVAVGFTRNKEVALAGLDNLLRYVENTYDSKVKSLVPSASAEQRAGGPRPTAATSQTLTPQDQAAVEWAQSHAGDPRAAKILRLHGM